MSRQYLPKIIYRISSNKRSRSNKRLPQIYAWSLMRRPYICRRSRRYRLGYLSDEWEHAPPATRAIAELYADMRMPAKLNSSHLHRHAGGKDWDDQCCQPLQFSYRNSIPGRFQAVPAAMSQAPTSNKRPSPPPSLSLIVRMHGKPSLRASSSITANEASWERTRSSHSRLLSRAVVAWLLATLPNEETKTCFYCHFIDNLVCKSYNGTKVVTWLPTGRT